MENNPQAKVITNKSIGAILEKGNIAFNLVEDGQSFDANGVLIEEFGGNHAIVHTSISPIQNTGYDL